MIRKICSCFWVLSLFVNVSAMMDEESSAEDSGRSAPARPLFLHIGPHKTGSTFLQEALGRNQDVLERMSISYFHPHQVRSPDFLEALQISLADNKHVLVSDEWFVGRRLLSNSQTRAKDFYPEQEGVLEKLKKDLEGLNVEIVPILYIRNQVSFLESSYMETIKWMPSFKVPGTEDDYAEYTFDVFRQDIRELDVRWNKVIDVTARVFGKKPVLRCFEQLTRDGEEAFLGGFVKIVTGGAKIESPLKLEVPPMTGKDTNRSLSAAASHVLGRMFFRVTSENETLRGYLLASLKAHLNNSHYADNPKESILAELHDILGADQLQRLSETLDEALALYPAPSKPVLFTPEEKDAIMARCHDSNMQILEEYGLEEFKPYY